MKRTRPHNAFRVHSLCPQSLRGSRRLAKPSFLTSTNTRDRPWTLGRAARACPQTHVDTEPAPGSLFARVGNNSQLHPQKLRGCGWVRVQGFPERLTRGCLKRAALEKRERRMNCDIQNAATEDRDGMWGKGEGEAGEWRGKGRRRRRRRKRGGGG